MADVQEKDLMEAIAVIGFSFKYPQEATTTDAFWEMLYKGRCASTNFPPDRLNVDAFYHPDYSRPDSFHFKGAHFLKEDLKCFDAPFFSITPAEAVAMDPHQSKLLEVTYHALENAGLPIERIAGTQTSVYTASFADDYRLGLYRDSERLPTYALTGTTPSFLANRLSWFYDLKGASLNIDTACSSSLVAVDHACQSLRNGDSNMSIVTGGNIVLDPGNMIALSNLNFMSPDSRSYSFDHRANGYAQGEGIGVVILQRLSDAIRDNNCIRAIIRSTGSNSDGRTPGISQPNPLAQEQLIRSTYRKAGLSLKLTRYFEAHATGTAVGDPLEAEAIGAAFASERTAEEPLFIGALKSNIGHLEGGAGIAGLIKTILILERGIIPPNANFEKVNPKIDIEALKIELPRKPTAWPSAGLRRASVNSFGFGGTNSHVVIEDAYNHLQIRSLKGFHRTKPWMASLKNSLEELGTVFPEAQIQVPQPASPLESNHSADSGFQATPNGSSSGQNSPAHGSSGTSIPDAPAVDRELATDGTTAESPRLLVWSAGDREGINRIVKSYENFFRDAPTPKIDEICLENLAYTLSMRRSSLIWKSFSVVKSTADLRHLSESIVPPSKALIDPSVAFVFTGQGSQWPQMGQDLLCYPVFKKSMEDAESYLRSLGCQWSLLDELAIETTKSSIHKPSLSQPIGTALQISLIDLLHSFSIFPAVVAGHSSGEIAAAYATGAISFQSSMKISYYRGLLSETLSQDHGYRGAMMAVGIGPGQAQSYLERLNSQFGKCEVVVACVNSPNSVTLSGKKDQILALGAVLDKESVFNRRLRVDVAYHSPQMDTIADEYQRLIGSLETGVPPSKPCFMVSSLKARAVTSNEISDTQYWVDNMTMLVRFAEAASQLYTHPLINKSGAAFANLGKKLVDTVVEIGPHSTLQGPIKESLKVVPNGVTVEYTSCLKRSSPCCETLLTTIGKLYCRGHHADLSKVNESTSSKHKDPVLFTDLPKYPFDASHTYWSNTLMDKGYRFREFPRNDLLGTRVQDWDSLDARWHNNIKPKELSWVKDHVVNGTAIYPGAGMIVMAIEASRQTSGDDDDIVAFEVRNVAFRKSIVIPLDSPGVEVSFSLRRLRDGPNKLSLLSEFVLSTYENDEWTENCRGTIAVQLRSVLERKGNLDELAFELEDYQKKLRSATHQCDLPLEQSTVYEYFRDCGLDYGPAFQRMEDILSDKGDQATAKVTIFPESSVPKPGPLKDCVVHPTTLDTFFHLLYVGLAKGCTERIPTSVPTYLQRLWISKEGLNSEAKADITAVSQLSRLSPFLNRSSLFALSNDDNSLRLVAEGIETTVVADESSTRSIPEQEQKYHRYEWKADLSIMSNQQLVDYLKIGIDAGPEPISFYEDLTQLLLIFTTETLDRLSNVDTTKFESHTQKHIAWMKLMQTHFQAGELPDSDRSWEATLRDSAQKEKLCNYIEKYSAQGKLFVAVGKNLFSILTGEVSIHELLFRDDLAENFYKEFYSAPLLRHSYMRYLDAMAHKYPTMKILEIGAGTGGATKMALEALASGEDSFTAPRFGQYDFTDISPSFFEKARERLPGYASRVNFKLFDVQQDPADQGFELGTYDMIIAFGSFHIAKDLEKAMRNAHKLLKPGGKFVLGESTKPEVLRTSFVFGLFPDWWLSTEDYREWTPGVSQSKWRELLAKNGFSGIDFIFHDYENETCKEVSVLVSTAVDERPRPSLPQIEIIVEPSSGEQVELASVLQAQLPGTEQEIQIKHIQDLRSEEITDKIVYLFLVEYDAPMLESIDRNSFEILKSVILSGRTVIWVTGGGNPKASVPGFGVVDGLARTLRNENGNLNFITVALDRSHNSMERHGHHISQILDQTLSNTVEDYFDQEYVEKNALVGINRLVEVRQLENTIASQKELQHVSMQSIGSSPPLKLSIRSPGLLETLEYIEDTDSTPLGPDQVEIKVKAVGISIVECLAALGRYKQGWLGGECSGVVTNAGKKTGFQEGDQVAFIGIGSFRTHARSSCAVRIPDGLSFTEAAAVPISFTLAWYALKEIARIRPGESVLIHRPTCGAGQALVQVARHLGADIFLTVGSQKKKKLVMDLFDFPEERILFHNNSLFVKGILRLTKGRGVDIVLSNLGENGTAASWDCIAPCGRFIQVGPDFVSDQRQIRLPPTSRIFYSIVDIKTLVSARPGFAKSMLEAVMELISSKKLHLPRSDMLFTYPSSEVEASFHDLLKRDNIGKTVVTIEDEDVVKTVLATKPAYNFDPKSTYLLVGGLGTCGRIICQWMVTRGARNFLLLSRSGGESSSDFIKTLQDQGARVEAPICDVGDRSSLELVLSQVGTTMPPIKGCINSAVIIRDILFEKMSFEDWEHVTRPKIRGSWNLHSLLPKDLDFFILLSSMAAAVGFSTQANYAAANTYQDALAQFRVANGQRGASLNLGPINEDGPSLRDPVVRENIFNSGNHILQSGTDLCDLMDYFCNPNLPLSELAPQIRLLMGIKDPAKIRASGKEERSWLRQRLFSHFYTRGVGSTHTSVFKDGEDDMSILLAQAPPDVAAGIVTEALIKKLSSILSTEVESFESHKPIHAYGIDSLVAVEIRNWISKRMRADVTIFDIMGNLSLKAFGELVVSKSLYCAVSQKA